MQQVFDSPSYRLRKGNEMSPYIVAKELSGRTFSVGFDNSIIAIYTITYRQGKKPK